MISKREKLQYVCTFVTDILSLALSIALGWLVVDGLLGKVGNYTASDLIQAFCLLMLAYLLTFLTFDQSENITTRPWKRELKISVKFNLILTLINSAGLLLTKAPLLSSRYFLVAVPVINVVLMTVFHSVLKKLLTTTRKKNSMESLVGVVTTGEDAGAMVRELQRPCWRSRKSRSAARSRAWTSRPTTIPLWTGCGRPRWMKCMWTSPWTAVIPLCLI